MKVIKCLHINLKFDVLSNALCDGYTAGPHFVTVRFTTIHFNDPCRVRLSTPDLWCISVATQVSFHYLVRFLVYSSMHVFLLFLF